MAVAARILERRSPIRAAVVVNDTEAAVRAHDLGVGADAEFHVGGAHDPRAVAITAPALRPLAA